MKMMNRGRSQRFARPLTLAVLLLLANDSWGRGIEYQETDTLPFVENILFTTSHVGFVSEDGRLFALERTTERVEQLDVELFAQQFPKPWPPKPFDPYSYDPRILRASSGQEFAQVPGVCDEGVYTDHEIRYQQRRFPDVLKPCTTVSAIEIVGNQVWFGTLQHSEAGEESAEGVIVQAVDKKQKLATITVKSGLTGWPILMLREDPVTHTIWVATDRGLNQIDRQFRVIWTRYWHEDFDSSTGRSRISLIPTRHSSNAFAVLGRELGVQDWQAYGQAVRTIPSTLAGRGVFKDFQWLLYDTHMSGTPLGQSYFPHELNGLVPFVIQAAESPNPKLHSFGLSNICKFDDARVRAFVKTLASKTSVDSADRYVIADCLERWARPTRFVR
ncbi:MAG: hypothetical protein JSR29_09115 [Nitrospira sp.]|nr:hypothetical protein [Nitrospira sp.]